jgi:cytochrome c biogenesis factor
MDFYAQMARIIGVYTMVFGVIGVFTIWKTPRNHIVRMALIVLYLPALYITAQLTFNPTISQANSIRIVFGGMTAAFVGSIIALIKKPND